MSLRGAVLAGIIVLAATGSGTAEFTTPSLDQWGDGAKRIGPRKFVHAGSEPSGAWVAPSSIALVSGAPVSLHTLPPDTVTTLSAGEELTLRWAYTRPASPYDVYYYGTSFAYDPATGMALPRAAVTPSGAVVTAPGVVVSPPAAAVTPSGAVVTAPGVAISTPAAAVTPSGAVVASPGVVVSTPGAVAPSGVVVSTSGTVVSTPGAVVSTPGTVVSTPGTVVTTPDAVVSTPGTVVSTPGVVVSAPSAVVTPSVTAVATPYRTGTYVREIDVPGQQNVNVLVDEGPWVTLSPSTVSIIRESR